MISILRPSTPPAALISSAAICAACGIEEPATACASAMTPILIGGLVCAAAGAASAGASAAAPPVKTVRNGAAAPGLAGGCMLEAPWDLRRARAGGCFARSLANGACPTSPPQDTDHAGLRPDCRRINAYIRCAIAAAQYAAAASRAGRARAPALYLAHVLVGEPASTPDQVRGRLSPEHALGPQHGEPEHHQDHEDHDEDVEQHARDVRARGRQAGEAEDAGDDRDQQKYQRPLEQRHGPNPFAPDNSASELLFRAR